MTNDLTQIKTAPLEIASFRFSPIGLQVVGTPTFEDWVRCKNYFRDQKEDMRFAIGDWLNYGQKAWREVYRKEIESWGVPLNLLREYKWVSNRIPVERRIKELRFEHHQQVVELNEEDQDEFLKQAVALHLSPLKLAQNIKKETMQFTKM